MKTIHYQIQFHDYWNTASGLSGGARADILTLKDKHGFPFVPGRTLKGLFREAAEVLLQSGLTTMQTVDKLFGEREAKETEPETEKQRKRDHGVAFFSNATFDLHTVKLLQGSNMIEQLFDVVAATAIDPENGIADSHTLRRAEVALPCRLYASIYLEIEGTNIQEYIKQISYCMQYVKRLGHRRSRGLGRCTISII